MGWLFATLYDRALRQSEAAGLRQWRRELLAQARGDVLEIGAGTGLNLEHYPQDVRLCLSEPDAHMRRRLLARAGDIEVLDAPAERLPLPAASLDTVVCTLVLCSVRDPAQCLGEIARVLRPGGRLLLIEHGLHPEPGGQRWQRWLEPVWKRIAAGCHLTRDARALLRAAGFAIEALVDDVLPKAPRFVRPAVRGLAVR